METTEEWVGIDVGSTDVGVGLMCADGYHKNGECRPPNPFTLRVLLALKTLTVVLLFDFRLADEFNRVQRGHQNFLESSDSYAIMTLIGGLKHPIACAVGSVCYCVGSVLYMKGYSDNKLDVKMARYKKGAGIKWIGFFASLISTCKLGYDLIKG
eukprot:scaffold13568_cov257-Alexandrium_tamarense.AAC.2